MRHLIFAASLMIPAGPLMAQDDLVCMDTAEAEAALIDWYNETPVSGNVEEGYLVWAAGIGKSWTLLSYEADGTSCTLAHGDDWSPNMNGDSMIAALVRDHTAEQRG